MINLKEVNFGMNKYCGPAVLSALTGESTDRCAAVISAVSGKREIKAVEQGHLIEALRRLRFDVEETDFVGSSLYGTLFRMYQHNGLYIIFVPHHVIAVEMKDNEVYICDNHTKTPLDIKQSARLSQKVERVLKVSRRANPKFIRAIIELDNAHLGANFRVDIISHNCYENSEDDTRYSLGHLYYKDNLELQQIIEALQNKLL